MLAMLWKAWSEGYKVSFADISYLERDGVCDSCGYDT